MREDSSLRSRRLEIRADYKRPVLSTKVAPATFNKVFEVFCHRLSPLRHRKMPSSSLSRLTSGGFDLSRFGVQKLTGDQVNWHSPPGVQNPCSLHQTPCSAIKIPCSFEQGIVVQAIVCARVFGDEERALEADLSKIPC